MNCHPTKNPSAGNPCEQSSQKIHEKKHRALIQELLHAYKIDPNEYKKIRPNLTGPKWSPRYATQIPENRSIVIEKIGKLTQEMRVYSDRSCIDRKVGAVAVMFKQGEEQHVLRKHVGDECQHTIYEAKVIGLALAAKLRKKRKIH